LACFQCQAELAQDRQERHEGVLGLLFGLAHHEQIVRVADQHSGAAPDPLPVEPVQVDIAQDG